MRTEVVNVEDVYPDENNPRRRFDGIAELAESFSLNEERPGEPFVPPILVRDGGIYRIVDGERRYKALRKLKAKTFTANVADSMDEANAIVAMVATDDKQPLDEMERSRGVQQMLLLGVDPVKVDRVSRGRDSKRIRRGMAVVDDAAQDMSLDRLLAIDEAATAGDTAAVDALRDCRESDWERVAEHARKERALREGMGAFDAALDKFGVPHSRDAADKPQGYGWALTATDPAKLATAIAATGLEPSAVWALVKPNWAGEACADLHVSASAQKLEEDAAQAERDRLRGELAEQCAMAERRRMAWVGERIANGELPPDCTAIAAGAFFERNEVAGFPGEVQERIDEDPGMAALALGWSLAEREADCGYWAGPLVDGVANEWQINRYRKLTEIASALAEGGYEAEPWEAELYARAADVEVER